MKECPKNEMWGKCGEIGYKNGLQVSVGHLRVPGAEVLLLLYIEV